MAGGQEFIISMEIRWGFVKTFPFQVSLPHHKLFLRNVLDVTAFSIKFYIVFIGKISGARLKESGVYDLNGNELEVTDTTA